MYYGPDKIEQFLQAHGLELICRAHECVSHGYEFQAEMKLVTIFSAPNYEAFGRFCFVIKAACLAIIDDLSSSHPQRKDH